MKNHIAFKFLAIVLCSLMLLSAVIFGMGILAFTAIGLSNGETPEEVFRRQTDRQMETFGQERVQAYASQTLGNCPEDLIETLYPFDGADYFRDDCIFYSISDNRGRLLYSTISGHEEQITYSITNQEYSLSYASIVPGGNEENWQDIWLPGHGGEPLSFRLVSSPEYNVTVSVAQDAIRQDPLWTVVRITWNYRYYVVLALALSLLLFAALAAYLCTTAGRKPGSDEIRPAAFNCLPLDLYLAADILIIGTIVVLAVESLDYMLRMRGIAMLTATLFFGGYLCCLLFVSFCFACAAQFKAPGYYWWTHSVCGVCWKIFVRVWNWFWKIVTALLRQLPRFILRCFRAAGILLRWLYAQVGSMWKSSYWFLRRGVRWVGRNLNRFYSLLPLVWQWLLVGTAMVLAIIISIFNRSGSLFLLSVIGSLIVVLYGANVFGTLLDAVSRMRRGELDAKVNESLMIGSYRHFAQELNGLTDAAVIAAQKQLKSERMKTELVTNVSHDIKTPLTSIINYVDLLQKPHTEEEGAAYLEVLSRQSQRMKKLIDDLMEMSKASTGNMTLEITEMDAVEAVNQALGEFADKLEKANLQPVFRQPSEQILMHADGRLVWRCMSNLLGNAVKYAMPGTRLYLDIATANGMVLISAKNISRDPLNISADELLERFVRGDSSRNTEGSGLGLNIAKSLMQLQHGDLQLLVDGDLFKATLFFPMA